MCTTHAWTVAVHDRQLELAALALALRELDAASHAAEAALLRAYPLLDEDPFFDPHAIDEDPHESAAESASCSDRYASRSSAMGGSHGPPGLLQLAVRDVLQLSPRADTSRQSRTGFSRVRNGCVTTYAREAAGEERRRRRGMP